MMQKSALVLGASGLVGSEVLKLCLASDNYNKVIAPVRSPLIMNHKKLIEKIIDFEMPPWDELFPVDHVYCCLGTTIKKAGSNSGFRKVDFDYPIAFADAAKKWNASVFSIVTATGANSNSKIFYNKVKGEVEDKLKSIGFDSTLISRPSLLLGERNEFRLGEKMVMGVAKLTSWMTPTSVRAIPAKTVARATVSETLLERVGLNIMSNKEMHHIG